MSRELLKYAGFALVGLIVSVGVVLFLNRGAHVVLDGSIVSVRTQAMNETSAVAVIDFRFVNPSDYPFIVRTTEVILEDNSGLQHTSKPVSAREADRLFQYYPLLGQKYNEVLKMRDTVEPDQSMDRMICALFDVPVASLENRTRLIIRVEDVDGVISEIAEVPVEPEG